MPTIEEIAEELRWQMTDVLKTKTKNQVVVTIQEMDGNTKFHQYTLDRFLNGKDVKMSTIVKIQGYLDEEWLNSAP